ncbi:hypothetical protein D3C79_818860 [compost metagenome]
MQPVAVLAQRLHLGIGVIDNVLVGTIGLDHQFAVLADHFDRAQRWHPHHHAQRRGDRHDVENVVIGGDVDIGIVVQQVTPWVNTLQAVVGTTGLDRGGAVRLRLWSVVDRGEVDDQKVPVGTRIARLSRHTVAIEIAIVALVIADDFEEIAAVEVLITQVAQSGQRCVDVGDSPL